MQRLHLLIGEKRVNEAVLVVKVLAWLEDVPQVVESLLDAKAVCLQGKEGLRGVWHERPLGLVDAEESPKICHLGVVGRELDVLRHVGVKLRLVKNMLDLRDGYVRLGVSPEQIMLIVQQL